MNLQNVAIFLGLILWFNRVKCDDIHEPLELLIKENAQFQLTVDYCTFNAHGIFKQANDATYKINATVGTRCFCVDNLEKISKDSQVEIIFIPDWISDSIDSNQSVCSIPAPSLYINNGTKFDFILHSKLNGTSRTYNMTYINDWQSQLSVLFYVLMFEILFGYLCCYL